MARNSNTLLALTLAALFAVHPCSAFHILPAQAPTRRRPSTTTASRIEGTWELPAPMVVRTRRSALLAAPWKSDRENNNRNNDNNNDAIGETAAPQSSRTTLQRRLHTLKCWIQFYGSRSIGSSSSTTTTNTVGTSRRRRKQRAAAKVLAASLAASAAGAPAPALARTFADNMVDGTQTFSLRPGVTREQAEQLTSGVMPDEVKQQESGEATSTSTPNASGESATKAAPTKAKKSDNLYGDYYGDDEDDFDELEFETDPGLAAVAKQRQGSFGSGTAPAKAIGSAGDASKMTRSSSFSGISKDASGGKKTIVYVKASLGVAVPVLGFLGIRNYVQHRREKKQVEYSLKVMDEKRAELFGIDKDGKNITKTEGEEEDDEDEEEDGSKPKGGDDDDDDDDDEDEDGDDDDDDDDEPPQRRRRSLPRPPSGPSGGPGGGSGGYDDNGGGDDGPSEDDIRKLGDLFNK